MKRNPCAAVAAVGLAVTAALASDPWPVVQAVLMSTPDIVVLDGTAAAPVRADRGATPAYGDWLVRHTLADPENLNPYTSSDAGASDVQDYVFESLLFAAPEPPFELRGGIAEAYPEVAADKLRYSFRVRPEVHFADGTPLTAADVLFSMKVIQHPLVLAPHLRNYYDAVADAYVEDGGRVTFVCDEPYFRNDLMLGGFKIIPRHFYDPEGLLDPVTVASLIDGSWEQGPHADGARRFADLFNREYNRRILGTGPFRLANPETDLVTQQKVVLTRNDHYWGRGVPGLPKAGYVDKIVFKVINNTDAAFIELTNGNLDYHTLQSLEFKEKSWDPGFVDDFLKVIRYSGGFTYIGWNNDHPIFSDRRVRQAMTCLTDRESMIRNLLFGLGETVVGPIHKFRPEYNSDLEPYPYDPERAVALLEEAGWRDSDDDGILDKVSDGRKADFRFEILINSGNQLRKDIALVVQSELQEIGIDCQVRELDWSVFLQRVRGQEFDAVVLGWTGNIRFPPDAYQVWHSSQSQSQGSNYVSFHDAEVDRILEDYRREFDMEKRIALYRRFQEILHAQQPYTFLWKQREASAYSRRFEGVTWYPGSDRGSVGEITLEWWVRPDDRMYQ